MADGARQARLSKHFDLIIQGKLDLTPRNSPLFLEAICAQPDAASCLHKLTSSKKGLSSVQSAMRHDLQLSFLNGPARFFLEYLSTPDLATIGGGVYLNNVLLAIVDPPIFFDELGQAFRKGELDEKAQLSFAWLLVQLVQLPGDLSRSFIAFASDTDIIDPLLGSPSRETRAVAQNLKHILAARNVGAVPDQYGPGGRHDNDHSDFHEIMLLPTGDEVQSDKPPFLRTSAAIEDPATLDSRVYTHLDNQFRLLREDMLYELREELKLVQGRKTGRHRATVLTGLRLQGIHNELSGKKCKWSIALECKEGIPELKNVKVKDRKAYLIKNRNFLKHQSMACLVIDDDIVAFPSIIRDEELLAQSPPVVIMHIQDERSAAMVLLRLKTATTVRLLQIDVAFFSYEPVLSALQQTMDLPLKDELLLWNKDDDLMSPSEQPSDLIQSLRRDSRQDLQRILNTSKGVVLDQAQAEAFITGLSQRVSLIQGPPGTGKSFIGALLAKTIHDTTNQIQLVVCYTNHALDQFLEDLLDIGIPTSSIVRLGGKSTPRTEPLSLHKLKSGRNQFKFGRFDWQEINELKSQSLMLSDGLTNAFKKYLSFNLQFPDIMDYLEFEDPNFRLAFIIPTSADGMQKVGKKGRGVSPDYLFNRWLKGENAGVFIADPSISQHSQVWALAPLARLARFAVWKNAMLSEHIMDFCTIANQYNLCQIKLDSKFSESDAQVVASKRIIGCTTTAAAKYRDQIRVAHPDVLLVEEAGEILESHVLTALSPHTKQMILIGDHKQLRPKVNNYLLTVEKGEGYDLNRSLFERLVLKGFPHTTLSQQHRMRPEISSLVRMLTYPDLADAPQTKNRPPLYGVRDTVVFINHDQPENDMAQIEERRDKTTKSSKRNTFEVGMVLQIVRYLAQQGYGTEKIVILTPYLGQLREFQEALSATNDPILNDLDSFDLVRAGLVSPSAAKLTRKPIHLATIDNYQGEESDVVIASLTRSNPDHDIGFMSAPERLNVLLSRARNALILIGNAETFMHARKGGDLWKKFIELLKEDRHIYDGFPVQCERHPDRTGLMTRPSDFDAHCPDGGCLQPCGTILSCGIHPCPSKCHQLSDHSKVLCEQLLYASCPLKGHAQKWKCHNGSPATCDKCDRETKLAEKKARDDFLRQERQDIARREHERKLAEVDEQIAKHREALRDAQLAEEREAAIEEKKKELAETSRLATRATNSESHPLPIDPPHEPTLGAVSTANQSTPDAAKKVVPVKSARDIWLHHKEVEGVTNDAIDSIMEMIGLEEVKKQVLLIMDKVDVSRQQNTTLAKERFNIAMLGNPGTGKTTVARLYGKFLASVQVLPGNTFVETTGSRLANNVPGAKKMLEEIINAGGGTIFVDEAYQLTSPHNYGGPQVLDFLLAEMENQVGKVVFIVAGYNKEMEKFFEHNPGLTSRVPYQLQFKDYEDDELLGMLQMSVQKKFKGRMKVDDPDGILGLYGRIAVRRLGRGRGRPGFGNARALENMLARIYNRQTERISKEKHARRKPDLFLLTKEDLIGPDPSTVMVDSAAWTKLQSMIGLTAVKQSAANMFHLIKTNYERELLEKKPQDISLNRVFLGSPGTGKTTVAKLYGQILAELGLISNGEVVTKNPADFVGSALGQSENQTKAILANTVGKVLIIDEAYMLYSGSGNATGGKTDPYKTAVIDTIVAEVQSVPGEDRCVLLLGYKTQIEEMFQNVNPGLARRFAIENAFHFHDYSDAELSQALDWKLKDQDLTATDAAKSVAIDVLSRARNRPNFGNIGEVENTLTQAKMRFQARQAALPDNQRSADAPFEPVDFDPDYNRNEQAGTNLTRLFEDVVGCEEIVTRLGKYQEMARKSKARGMDPREVVPTNYVFKGPPGTGKTTTARKMGQVYYDMGFLSSTELIECSASDLVGQYVGQTGPKTKKLFEKALGKVLFIDEAYRLSEGAFAKEAMDELVGILTQEAFRAKLVVILAGYDQEMNELLSVNAGLSSRFPEEIFFRHMTPQHCLEILKKELRKQRIHLPALDDESCDDYETMVTLLKSLSELPSWGNARDVKTLAKEMVARVLTSDTSEQSSSPDGVLRLSEKDAITCILDMLQARRERCDNIPSTKSRQSGQAHTASTRPSPPAPAPAPAPAPPSVRTTHTTQTAQATVKRDEARPAQANGDKSDDRDPGVADDIWQQLQMDKQAAEAEAKRSAEASKKMQREIQEQVKKEKAEAARIARLIKEEANARDEARRNELMRQREQARLKELAARAERERIAAALEAKRKEEEKARQEEQRVQTKLQQMGVCVAGFRWTKQPNGYRCAGGYHFIDNQTLGI